MRRVRVKVTSVQEAGEQVRTGLAIDAHRPGGVTDDSGELVLEVPAGDWKVEATAFGQTGTSEPVTVRPKCETCVKLVLPINLYVSTEAVTGAGKQDHPKFYSAGTIIAAHVASTSDRDLGPVEFEWTVSAGSILEDPEKATGSEIHIDTSGARGRLDIGVTMIGRDNARVSSGKSLMVAPAATVPVAGSFNIGLRRSASVVTPDLPLWVVIRNSTDGLSFKNYQRYIDVVLCDASADGLSDGFPTKRTSSPRAEYEELKKRRFLPFSDSDAYRLLKVATEAFVMVNCGVALDKLSAIRSRRPGSPDRADRRRRSRDGSLRKAVERIPRASKRHDAAHPAIPGAHREQVPRRPHQEPNLLDASRGGCRRTLLSGSSDRN